MRLLLTAAFLMTAATGAAFAEGRFVTTSSAFTGGPVVFITDSKTGAVRYCRASEGKTICTPWTK